MTTYGDMVTLLLTFFVLLYAFSIIDAQKYIQISNSLRCALGGNVGVLNQGTSLNTKGSLAGITQPMKETFKQLQGIVGKQGMQGKVELSMNSLGITISFKEKLFFNIGSADILAEAYPILDDVGAVLKGQTFPIRVEGHTCDLPIKNSKFPSNWELSAIRAVNVGKFLIERDGVAAERLSTAAYSQYRPMVPNISEANRARNRRVDIVIVNTAVSIPGKANNENESKK